MRGALQNAQKQRPLSREISFISLILSNFWYNERKASRRQGYVPGMEVTAHRNVGFLARQNVLAENDGSFTSYDAIVNELKADAEGEPEVRREELNWDEVALSGGMALAGSFVSLTSPNGAVGGGMLKGFEIYGGVNLFSTKAKAEVAFRSFAPEDFGKIHIDLRDEIEGRLIFLPALRDKINLRMGMGLTMRYMDIEGRFRGITERAEARTPASSLILGFDHRLSQNVSVGPDLAYRSAINDSFDKSAWDAAIRLNAQF